MSTAAYKQGQASAHAAMGLASPQGYTGPFPKLRAALTQPKVLAAAGLLGGTAYAANQLSKDPQMSVTPSAPLAYYP